MEQRVEKALMFVLLFLVAMVGWQLHSRSNQIEQLQLDLRQSYLVSENLAAQNSVTVLEKGYWQRRALQMNIERDSLAEELDQRPVVETIITVEVPADTVYAPAVSQDSIIVSQFDDSILTAEVKYRPAPMTMSLDYQIKPITLNVGVRCAPVDTVSLAHPAIITIEEGVQPMTFTVEEGVIDPEVCNPVPVGNPGHGFHLRSAVIGAVAVLGILLIGR